MRPRRKLNPQPGDRFGKLTIVSEAPRRVLPSGQKPREFICKCDCGNSHSVLLVHLVRGRSKSCGCIVATMKGETKTKLHRKWKSMLERCMPNAIDKHRYFERGIKVCDEWKSDFYAFKKWALENGYKEELQIDRINNGRNYEPSNCRFVTVEQNMNNRDVTYKVNYRNESIPLKELIRKKNLTENHYYAIRSRIKRGWNHTKAVETPLRVGNYFRGHRQL